MVRSNFYLSRTHLSKHYSHDNILYYIAHSLLLSLISDRNGIGHSSLNLFVYFGVVLKLSKHSLGGRSPVAMTGMEGR